MQNFTACEWEIIVAAFAYEILDRPTMSDFTYDMFCEKLASKTTIPGFDASSGMWIYELNLDLVELVYEKARSLYPKMDEIHHHQIVKALRELGVNYTCCNQNVCMED